MGVAAVPSIGRATRVDAPVAPEAEATRTLYERYANQIFGYCVHQLGSREEAEDAVQSTFLNAFRGLRSGVVPESESAWLFKIAQNVCLSRHRSSWRRGRVESPADFELVEEMAPAPSRRADELIGLQDVLEQMPENQRRAILLREWQGMSYREIGEELELSQAAVETLIFRARRSLAQGLESSPAEQRSWRERVRALDLGSLVGAIKSLLASGAAVKMTTAAAVVAVSSVAATTPVTHHPHPPAKHPHWTPAPKTSPAAVTPAPTSAAGFSRQHVAAVQPKHAAPVRRSPHRLFQAHPAAKAKAASPAAAPTAAGPSPDPPVEQTPAPAPAPAPQDATPAPAPQPTHEAPPPAPPAPAARADDKPKPKDSPAQGQTQGQTQVQGTTQTSQESSKDKSKDKQKDGQGQGQRSDGQPQVTPSSAPTATPTPAAQPTSSPDGSRPNGGGDEQRGNGRHWGNGQQGGNGNRVLPPAIQVGPVQQTGSASSTRVTVTTTAPPTQPQQQPAQSSAFAGGNGNGHASHGGGHNN
ncbi:MAG: RNA polymerase sigma factor [Actinobacteria bacterium]|nr:MAG: RNA polymerase sigma factor [Actinomycetota bacterium]